LQKLASIFDVEQHRELYNLMQCCIDDNGLSTNKKIKTTLNPEHNLNLTVQNELMELEQHVELTELTASRLNC
jgi:hypothetical protein